MMVQLTQSVGRLAVVDPRDERLTDRQGGLAVDEAASEAARVAEAVLDRVAEDELYQVEAQAAAEAQADAMEKSAAVVDGADPSNGNQPGERRWFQRVWDGLRRRSNPDQDE